MLARAVTVSAVPLLGAAVIAVQRPSNIHKNMAMKSYRLSPTCELVLKVGDLTEFQVRSKNVCMYTELSPNSRCKQLNTIFSVECCSTQQTGPQEVDLHSSAVSLCSLRRCKCCVSIVTTRAGRCNSERSE